MLFEQTFAQEKQCASTVFKAAGRQPAPAGSAAQITLPSLLFPHPLIISLDKFLRSQVAVI